MCRSFPGNSQGYTGLRFEEILGLQWEDFNLETREIKIQRAVVHPTRNQPIVKLLRLAQELDGAIVTGDGGLYKAACAAGVRALSLNELAFALRPAVAAGDELTVQIVKEGKEPGQGVAYMPDGTMLVVEGGRRLLGESAAVVVTSVLQTSAGRMVFARVK